MNRQILIGDVLEKMKEIPDQSIDNVTTSPPYWGLRDYGLEDQWGLEPDFNSYLDKLRKLMFELKRVLKETGSCWINLGDTYAGGRAHFDFEQKDTDQKKYYSDQSIKDRQFTGIKKDHIGAKSLYGIPERFYTQCIDDGWLARNFIPWIKPAHMPASVTDRFTNMWERVFFFTKNQQYYFDLDAVREDPITRTDSIKPKKEQKNQTLFPGSEEQENDLKQDNTPMADGKPDPTKKGFNDRWRDARNAENRKYTKVPGQTSHTVNVRQTGGYYEDGTSANHPKGKNPGDVFVINPRPFPKAHFATFPYDLPLFILKCACPKGGTVLDPFFGSGTVGIAAEMLGINWIGIKLDLCFVERNIYC